MVTMFENKITITKGVFAEVSQKIHKIYYKKYRSFVLLISIISTSYTVKYLLTDGLDWFSIYLFLASAFFLFVFFKSYLLKLNSSYKNYQCVYGKLPQLTSKFYDEKVEISTINSSLTIEYSQITKILETENLYLLMIGRQSIILIKSGFINGSIDNFNLFIREKCKNV